MTPSFTIYAKEKSAKYRESIHSYKLSLIAFKIAEILRSEGGDTQGYTIQGFFSGMFLAVDCGKSKIKS